ncbi:MAG TPA: PBP1A family penicillin-binding protein [Vicinamibacterales bacterium]|jgi:penicillin-binding protein 1A|nr:PBP1A family penicillin-binding protein [Vicinamibacterales bacterium]
MAHLLQPKGVMASTMRQRMDELMRVWHESRRRHPRIAIGVVAAFVLIAVVSAGGGVLFLAGLRDGLPDMDAMRRIGEMDQATTVFDDKDRLAFTIFKEQRIEVPLTEVSPNLTKAITSIEDQRFYDHHGFDLVRIASAALANLRHNRRAQGGSTITQQLARQSFLTPNKSYHRKVQELILAARLERLYTKPQILELYFNKIYFGDGLYGVEAASRGFFGKHASEVTVAEAALLAGLVKSPSSYAPTVSMERAMARRNTVLQAMLDAGAIDRDTYKSARASKAVLHDTLREEEPHGLYFKEQVRQELVNRFGWQRVYQGGLRVFSTIDMPMQIAAETAIADQIASVEGRRAVWQARRAAARQKDGKTPAPARDPSDVLQAALVALEPATGHVRAMVGGRDFDASHFNRAVQAHRQAGSSFKPFVYAAALEAGFTPATVLDHLDDPIATAQGAWTPEDEHSSASTMTLRTGLRTSSNRAAVRLLQQVGIPRTVQYAKTMGVGDVPSVPSLALGSGEVTLQQMTAAYAAFPNHGLVPTATLIRRVEDLNGRVLYQSQESSVRAISDITAYLMSTMLADVINAGTGSRARALGFTLPAAGKTGTTNDFNDAWFIGFTPKLVTGVWVGFDQPKTILPNGFAAEVAVPAWAKFMKAATHDDKPEWLTSPAGVISARVCRLSGLLATEGCEDVDVVNNSGELERRSMVYTEYFARGTEPSAFCDQHPTRGLLTKIAGLFGGQEHPAPPHLVDTGAAPAAGSTATATATSGTLAPIETSPPPPKKRGFWSRIFGRDNPSEPSAEQPPTRKKGG